MKIVVEGYDASGKSTLANALAEKLGLNVLEAGPKPPNNKAAIEDSIRQFETKEVVHCRITPISRLCYQIDNHSDHERQLMDILSKYLDLGTLFIYCTGVADTHEIKDYDTKEHLEYLNKNESTIRNNYDMLFSVIDHIEYDFKSQDMEEFVCQIVMHF